MKKIIVLFLLFVLISTLIIPVGARLDPKTEGSYVPPPSPSPEMLTASFKLIRSYADVYSIFISPSVLTDSALVDGVEESYYPTTMFATPNTIVARSTTGFGDVENYNLTSAYWTNTRVYALGPSGATIESPDLPSTMGGDITISAFDLAAFGRHLYTYNLNNGNSNFAYQYGSISGEWSPDSTSTDDILTGYAIKWNSNVPITIQLKGKLTYGGANGNTIHVDLDREYNVAAGRRFNFNPQTLLEYEDTVNFEYYLFVGNWVVYSETAGYLIEYKLYDENNPETVEYSYGHNLYQEQEYSMDLNPLLRISNNLSLDAPTGNFNILANGVYNVSRFATVTVDVPQEIIEDVDAFNWLFGAVNGFLEMEILPGFSLGGIFLFVAGLALLVWILKIFLGG